MFPGALGKYPDSQIPPCWLLPPRVGPVPLIYQGITSPCHMLFLQKDVDVSTCSCRPILVQLGSLQMEKKKMHGLHLGIRYLRAKFQRMVLKRLPSPRKPIEAGFDLLKGRWQRRSGAPAGQERTPGFLCRAWVSGHRAERAGPSPQPPSGFG